MDISRSFTVTHIPGFAFQFMYLLFPFRLAFGLLAPHSSSDEITWACVSEYFSMILLIHAKNVFHRCFNHKYL